MTRANDRTLTYGRDDSEWVRNGDRWTINARNHDPVILQTAAEIFEVGVSEAEGIEFIVHAMPACNKFLET